MRATILLSASAILLGCVHLPIAAADDSPKPTAPSGWQTVFPRDRTYEFLFPKETRGIGSTSRKFTARGIRAEVLVDYCTTHDGISFNVEAAALSGLKLILGNLKDDELYEIMLEGERQQRFIIGNSKDVAIGKRPAREYRLSKDNIRCRVLLLTVRNRVFMLRVSAGDESKLDTDQANTFFQSFAILKESPEEAKKELTARKEARVTAAMEKLGFRWTLRIEEMAAPDKPVAGLVRGQDFKPDSIVRDASGDIVLRQGAGSPPDIQVRIVLFAKPNETFENRTIEVKPGVKSASSRSLIFTTHDPETHDRTTSTFFDKFAMKLTFGARDADGMVTCSVYLCTADDHKSFVAGSFKLPAK